MGVGEGVWLSSWVWLDEKVFCHCWFLLSSTNWQCCERLLRFAFTGPLPFNTLPNALSNPTKLYNKFNYLYSFYTILIILPLSQSQKLIKKIFYNKFELLLHNLMHYSWPPSNDFIFSSIFRLLEYLPQVTVAASILLLRERGLQNARFLLRGALLASVASMLADTFSAGGRWTSLQPLSGGDRYAGYAIVTGYTT